MRAAVRAMAALAAWCAVVIGCAGPSTDDEARAATDPRGGTSGAEETRGTEHAAAGADAGAGPTAAGGAAVSPFLVCATDADCTLVPGVCGGVVPVNLTHEAEERRSQEMAAAVASCAAPLARPEPHVARCAAGACVAFVPP